MPRHFLLAIGAVTLCFSPALYSWVRFSLQSDLYSYVLLVPVVSIYLFMSGIKGSNARSTLLAPRRRMLGTALTLSGLAVIGGYLLARYNGVTLVSQDSVAITTVAYVLLIGSAAVFLLPQALLGRATFPLLFLIFMAPFPVAMEHAIEMFLQHGSAPPSYWFFKLAGTPVYRDELIFQLPGMTLQIAPECSGIRSTIVLFLTSLVASHLFLKSTWKRALLVGFVLPLALIRNGFRIFVIGELCVHIGPHMIDSVIHHRGGPIFFALSLIPFSIFVYILVKSDRAKTPLPSNSGAS